MHKSTVFFAFTTLFFASTTGYVGWRLWHDHVRSPQPAISGATSKTLPLSIPRTEDTKQRFSARSALLYDAKQDKLLFEQNSYEQLPIASISKLMAAMVALDHGIPWDKTTTILPEEYVQGGQLMLFRGETVTLRNLFNASLLGSANNATLAYTRELGMSNDDFVQAMNRKAVEIGLEQTHFVGATGLDPRNASTAYEVAKMANYAFTNYPEIAKATSQPEYTFTFGGSGREHTIRNTNKLISDDGMTLNGSKTGYLYEAGYCLVVAGANEKSNLIAVVLNSPSEPEHFADIARLLQLSVQF